MGISGLLPLLKSVSRECHVKEFQGATVAIDAYCWLHKGAYSCFEQLSRGEGTFLYIQYCFKYLRTLEAHGIKPIMVFDGKHLVAKEGVEEKRRSNRQLKRNLAQEALHVGNILKSKRLLKQCQDITHEMAHKLIQECRKEHIDCIVAPYEADAQLTYLNLQGIADIVITEDSDLVMFGCTKIIYKLDVNGNGILVEKENLVRALGMRPNFYSFDKFRYMCILSGCDYLTSLSGIGLKRAQRAITAVPDYDLNHFLKNLHHYLRISRQRIPATYIDDFKMANNALLHQIVYDPLNRKLVRLTPILYEIEPKLLRGAGEMFDNKEAFELALGNIDPITSKVVDNWNPDEALVRTSSIWSRIFVKQKIKPPKVQQQDNVEDGKVIVNINRYPSREHEDIAYDKILQPELKSYYIRRSLPTATITRPIETTSSEDEMSEGFDKQLQLQNPFRVSIPLSKFGNTKLEDVESVESKFFKSIEGDQEATCSNLSRIPKVEDVDQEESLNNEPCKVEDFSFINQLTTIKTEQKPLNINYFPIQGNSSKEGEVFNMYSEKSVARSSKPLSTIAPSNTHKPKKRKASNTSLKGRPDKKTCRPESNSIIDMFAKVSKKD